MAGFSDFLSAGTMRRLDHLELASRRVAEGARAGRHQSRKLGASAEFSSHRDYVQGDNLRHLDWKVYGRRERFYIKEYHEETSLRVHIVLDASASMGFSHGGRVAKFAFARELAAATAYVAGRQQDAVGLVVYDDEVRALLPARAGTRHTRRLLETLAAHEPGGRTDTRHALQALAAGIARRGMVIMMSDLLDEPDAVFAAMAHFRRRGNDVLLWQILDPAEIDLPFEGASDFIDMETGETLECDPAVMRQAYHEAVAAAIDSCRARCAALRADYRLVTTAGTPVDFLRGFLEERVRRG